MAKNVPNIAASVHQHLLNKAKESSRPFNELLQYYAIERFIYRLSKSPYAEQFVLKGALMFSTSNERFLRYLDHVTYFRLQRRGAGRGSGKNIREKKNAGQPERRDIRTVVRQGQGQTSSVERFPQKVQIGHGAGILRRSRSQSYRLLKACSDLCCRSEKTYHELDCTRALALILIPGIDPHCIPPVHQTGSV